MNNSIVPVLALLAALAGSTDTAHAQGSAAPRLGGAIYDGSTPPGPAYAGGPLQAGVVYHVDSNINVPVGYTLTIQPGAVLKFDIGTTLTVSGTLTSGGTGAAHVVFTSIFDDSIGGDTNGNGPTFGFPGGWNRVAFTSTSDASSLQNTDVRFAGSTGPAVSLDAADIQLAGCSVTASAGGGVFLGDGNAFPSISSCSFTSNYGLPIYGAAFGALCGLQSNTASGNTLGNHLRVSGPSIPSTMALTKTCTLNASGVVELAPFTYTVPAGITLTLGPGLVFKWSSGPGVLNVNGILNVAGSQADPVYFTSLADDAVGGDTNANGPSQGAPGDWGGFGFSSTSSASVLSNLVLRYWGQGGRAGIFLNQADITLQNSRVERGANWALHLNGNTLNPTVSNCAFADNGAYAVADVPLQALDGFLNNTATGNAGGNHARVTNTTIASGIVLGPQNLLNQALVLTTSWPIPAGLSVTLQAGCIVKSFANVYVNVYGTLVVNGTANAPVSFTSYADDAIGGDTNGNGASSGTPGDWGGIWFYDTADGSMLQRAAIHFAGAAGNAGIQLDGADISVSNTLVRKCASRGIDLAYNIATLGASFTGCTVTENAGVAVDDARIQALSGFANLTAAQNTGGNYVRVTGGTLAMDLSVMATDLPGGVVLASSITIAAGTTWTLGAGTIVKAQPGASVQIAVYGRLLSNGTPSAPVVFTSLSDDSAGGDTNVNGSSLGTPGDWYGFFFYDSSDLSSMSFTEVRFGGLGTYAGVTLDGAAITMQDCTIRDCYASGLDLYLNSVVTSGQTIRNCRFLDNGGVAVNDVWLQAVPGFRNNVASGNQGGDYMRIVYGNPSTNLAIGPENCLNGALVFVTSSAISAGLRVVLQAGVIFKWTTDREMLVYGQLDILGTAQRPVVFTDYADDEHAGDTNRDGVSVGSPGTWRRLYYDGGATACRAEHLLLRYGGRSGYSLLQNYSSLVKLDAIRAEHGFGHGFELYGCSGAASNLVAWDCGDIGIYVSSTAFDVIHATVANCVRGIFRNSNWSGQALNCISWNNSQSNYVGFSSGQVRSSNGTGTLAGSLGNIHADPMFAAPNTGDLRLQAGSPSMASADPMAAPSLATDHLENPRVLEGAPGAAYLPDMGAFESLPWRVSTSGTPAIGSTMALNVSGPAGAALWFLGALEATTPLAPIGTLLIGTPATVLPLQALLPAAGAWPTDIPLPLPIPADPALVGLQFGLQAYTAGSSVPLGSLCARCRLTLHW